MSQVLNQSIVSVQDYKDFAFDVFVESSQPYSAYRMFARGGGIRRADNIHHYTVVQTPKVHVTLSQNILTFST